LRAAHGAAKNGAPLGVGAQEFQKESRYAVKKQICTDDLAFKALALEQPPQYEEVRQLDQELVNLRRMNRYV
jgi:hypothetical protein